MCSNCRIRRRFCTFATLVSTGFAVNASGEMRLAPELLMVLVTQTIK
jgi:hypothetical protein